MERLQTAFPLHMDMTKIAGCKQQDEKMVTAYLSHLMDVHERHSRLEKPAALAQGDDSPGPWQAHLENNFLSGMKPNVAQQIKQQCILWETMNLTTTEQYDIHAEKNLREKEKRGKERRENELHRATLTMYQHVTTVNTTNDTQRGRGQRSRENPQG